MGSPRLTEDYGDLQNGNDLLPIVKLNDHSRRLITALLALALMLAPPVFAHNLSGSTCGADVVFLWSKKDLETCEIGGALAYNYAARHEHCGPRPGPDSTYFKDGALITGEVHQPIIYGHTKAVIDALAATGSSIRFGMAAQSFDPATTLAVGNYGDISPLINPYDGIYGRARLDIKGKIEQQLFAAVMGNANVARYHNPKGLSAAVHNASRGSASGATPSERLAKPDHLIPPLNSNDGINERCQVSLGCAIPTPREVAASSSKHTYTETHRFNENQFGRAGPNGIAFDSKGNAYVLNAGRNEVYKMSHLGAVMAKWGGHGSGPGQFAHMAKHGGMMGIAIGPKHNIFITDQGNFRVQVFSQEGAFRSEFGTRGRGNGQFLKPTHVAADSEGNVYVTDWERRDIQKFVPGTPYKWALTFGGKETKDYEQGRFYKKADAYGPNGIAVNSKDLIHVSDSGNCRVQVFDSDGNFKHQIPSAPHTPANPLLLSQKKKFEAQYDRVFNQNCGAGPALYGGKPTKEDCDLAKNGDSIMGVLGVLGCYVLKAPGVEQRKNGCTRDEYVQSHLRSDASNMGAAYWGCGKAELSEFIRDGWPRSCGFKSADIAALYGARVVARAGPVDVCNNLPGGKESKHTPYDLNAHFRGHTNFPWTCKLGKTRGCTWTRSAQPEYPTSKWVGPGAIAIGKDDALFVVDVPAAETEDSWGSTPGDLNMTVKQFSAAGKYLGVVMKNGTTSRLYGARGPISSMPDLPALAIRRPRSGAGEPKFGTVSMHTSFRDEVMDVAFQIKQKLTASTPDALKAVATGAGATISFAGGSHVISGSGPGKERTHRSGDLFALHQLATSGAMTPHHNLATGVAPGWRTAKDVARIIVWYGDRAAGNESANVEEVITQLKKNDITVLAINTQHGVSFHGGYTHSNDLAGYVGGGTGRFSATAPGYGQGRARGIDCPEITRLTLKTAPMLGGDFKMSEFAGPPGSYPDNQMRAPCTLSVSAAVANSHSKLVRKGPMGRLCVDGCSLSKDGDGQATRIIDATGGAYQHLLEGSLKNKAWLDLWDHHGKKGKKRKDGSCANCTGPSEAWNGGKGNYEPTVKFILDQFSPPPMAGSSVPVTVSNDRKTMYVAKFDDGKATGDLEAWSLSAAYIPTSIKWSSAKKLDARSRLASRRNALTYSEGGGVKMEWKRLGDAQKTDFLAGRSAEAIDQARLKFLLGDRSKEGSEFHQRSSVLGPIARSAPVYVGKPNQKWLASAGVSAYATFLKKVAKRNAMVYVGSNGGALHGFDAVSGEEKLAYYPGALYRTGHGGYHDLAMAGFKHRTKYVDGIPSVSDVKVDGKWKTVLVSSLGGGGRGLFALDVTDPTKLNDAGKTVLWEFTHKDDPHLGYTHSKPILTQMNNGKWAAIIGNGQGASGADGTAGQAQLFIVYLDGPGGDGVWDLGKEYLRISTGEGTAASRNALFAPIGIDTVIPQDGKVDLIYAGDLYGNLWRFDVTGSSWSSPAKPFFKGDKTRPITAIPAVGIAPASVTSAVRLSGKRSGAKTYPVMVFFGSGRLLADADKGASIINRFYGVYDDGSKLELTEADLTVQQKVYSTATARVYKNDLDAGYAKRKSGWYMTLSDAGERVIDRALVKGSLVYFNTVIPDTSTCDAGGKGWEMVVQMKNGGSATGIQWDFNQNGSLDAGDTYTGLSYAGRKTAKGQLGAPQIIGDQLFSPLTDKIKPGAAAGPRDHFKNTKIASTPGTSGRISWTELQQQESN